MQNDPIGYGDGMNLYEGLASNPVRFVDPMGTLAGPGIDVLVGQWTTAQRRQWRDSFIKEYGAFIKASALRNCVPEELLAAVIANEVVEWLQDEQDRERNGWGDSVGPAQIQHATAVRESLYTTAEWAELNAKSTASQTFMWGRGAFSRIGSKGVAEFGRDMLLDPATNIDFAGRLARKYLDVLCKEAQAGTLTNSFVKTIGGLMSGDPKRIYVVQKIAPR